MQNAFVQLSIPHPCTKGWDNMTPSGNGRYCNACDKVVTDFTHMTDGEIQDFFLAHQTKKICGHFRKSQLERTRVQIPSYFLEKRNVRGWKKFLAILFICFSSSVFSFDMALAGTHNNTFSEQRFLQGEPVPVKKKKKKKKCAPKQKAEMISETIDGGIGINVIKWQNPFRDTAKSPRLTDSLPLCPDKDKQNDPPSKNIPVSNTEFILPAAIVARKRKKR
jgi:hypothetical protein